ncbi:glycine cleavage T C-terminal barrel domain-containing protein [Bradyrhizobium sp. WU425]|uniref:glycine cleavage T C-terminal barrel domain-containing protein n=1 Tax=Bradyrhizobium sp. WU425 TaxID=187029 RepID=UPI001E499083|nr:glycine cleavage T C-terminal barrel domain-containing protein [Bradyrhizobium canariense]UFW71398.1 hypothetical protein BcanWU425_32980 [Bradyrhizobium canariense]
MIHLALNDPNVLIYHNEPIWHDGRLVGRSTSGMFGHTVGTCLGLGFIDNSNGMIDATLLQTGNFEVEVAGVRIPACASRRPFYDPNNGRVKGVRADALVSAAAS